ncbi:MAG: 50S ribosomal protein L11 methyltransferase [Candidatus Marinimicrobia bacterium]|nr:50S ribosomal protein L11 methyltransferase [Candidatus Neomarinimicrobiota bacterium]
MYPDYVKIKVAYTETISNELDKLIESGEILSVETKKNEITVLDLWENRDKLIAILKRKLPDEKLTVSKLEGRDWNREWIEGFQPIRIGRKLWVTPPWQEGKISNKHEKIIINPGNAFGTGTHESTFLALKLMKKTLMAGDEVLDLGCGSGILSIAARKMGAGSVHAIDNDPEIEHNLNENLEKNNMKDISWEICDILSMDTYSCDLALINIQKHVILPLLERFSVAKGTPNRVILAGLLYEHKKDIRNALKERGYKTLDIRRMNEWMAVSAIRRRMNET